MTCRRAFDVDLPLLLRERSGPDWKAFRDHWPRCAECAAEVRAWTDLQAALEAVAHPDPDRLVALVDAPASLAADERASLERHLATCTTCREEAAVLRALAAAAAERAAVRVPDVPARPSGPRRRGVLEAIGRVVWHPAFAYALVVVVAVPLLAVRLFPFGERRGSTPELRAPVSPAAPEPPAAKEQDARRQDAPSEAPPPPPAAARPEPSAPARSGAPPREPVAPERAVPAREAARAPGDAVGSGAGAPASQPALGDEEAGEPSPRAKAEGIPAGALGRLAAAEREAGELRLRPGVVASVGTAHDLRLVLEVPPGVPAVVVVRSPDARRELRQTVVAPAGEARVDVPAAWLSPGEHVVIVEAGGRETSPLRFIVTPR